MAAPRIRPGIVIMIDLGDGSKPLRREIKSMRLTPEGFAATCVDPNESQRRWAKSKRPEHRS